MEETNNTTPQPTTAYGSNGGAAESYFAVPGDSTGSGSGSLQNDGFLSSGGGGGGGGDGSGYDAEFGFQRPEFLTEKLAGTVQVFDRHIFLCYKTPHVWPPQIEAAEFDRLPRLLSAAVKARRGDMKKLTRLTICEGEDGTESSNGDVLFFPDMIRYSRLTHFDVDTFVEETLVKDIEWMPGAPEKLTGSYVFVCAHGSRDRRCGVCGPPLIKKFKEEINIRGLQDKVFVSPCSHIGGHKYAGNVIIFSRMGDEGEVKGNWYGYVSPDDVPALLDQHIAAGEILPHLWRGQMGMSKEEHKKTYELWFQANEGIKKSEQGAKDSQSETVFDVPNTSTVGCCGGSNNSSCCQTQEFKPEEKLHDDANLNAVKSPKATAAKNSSKGAASNSKKTCAMSTWFECWEREDTYAALAVIAAAATVTFAYGCYKHLK